MKELAGILVLLCLLHFQVCAQKETAGLLKDLDQAIAARHLPTPKRGDPAG